MENTLRRYRVSKGYTLVNGAVYEVQLKATYFIKDENWDFTERTLGVTSDGTTVIVENLYENLKDIESNKKADLMDYAVSQVASNIIRDKSINSESSSTKDYYTLENGTITAHSFDYDVIQFDYEKSMFLNADIEAFDVIYATEQDAISYSKMDVVPLDENEPGSQREGINHMAILTDEQNVAMEELKSAFNKLKSLGVSLFFEMVDCNILAFNMNRIKLETIDYGGGNSGCYEEMEVLDRYGKPFNTGLTITYLNEDDSILVTRKLEESSQTDNFAGDERQQ